MKFQMTPEDYNGADGTCSNDPIARCLKRHLSSYVEWVSNFYDFFLIKPVGHAVLRYESTPEMTEVVKNSNHGDFYPYLLQFEYQVPDYLFKKHHPVFGYARK